MGIQINGQTDIISATDGALNVSGADFTGVSAGSTSAPSISPTGNSNTGIFFPSPDTVAIAEGGVEALRVDNNRRIIVAASTPLTSAAAGAVEYDGKVVYSTPAGRGVSPSMMFYRLDSGLVGANVNTAQNLFGVGVTLQASTVYAFEYKFSVTKSAGTISHTLGLGFGGTATINNILYFGNGNSVTGSGSIYATSADNAVIATASNFVVTGSGTVANRLIFYSLSGTVSVNAGGTFIPQYTLSAAPGGAYTTNAGSCFAIWPIGAAGANTSVGPWT
jgi:hypothetical protein